MMLPAALRIEREFAFWYFPHQQFVARLQLVKPRRECSFRHQLKEKFNFIFKRRRGNRIRTLRPLAIVLHTQRGVLARDKLELPAGLDANHPQVRSELHPLGDPRPVKLLVPNRHLKNPRKPWRS